MFLVAAVWRGSRRLRLAALAVVGVAAVPIAYSLNRGLWVALVLVRASVAWCCSGCGADRGCWRPGWCWWRSPRSPSWSSPLRDLAEGRVDNQHSNARRGQLLSETVVSVSTGSPVVGFGSTRDVQGSFGSIAGGETPSCPACGVPPLGTQGHLWLVLFSQGWLGLAFFLLFVVLALVRSARCRTTNETVCTFVVAIFLLQLAIYDTLGLPLMTMMIAVGLVARERLADGSGPATTSATLARDLRRSAWVLTACAVLGAAVGGTVSVLASDREYRGRVAVAVTPAPVYLEPAGLGEDATPKRRTRDITLDTEVALLLSQRAVASVSRTTGVDDDAVRRMVAVTAAPNSHVLEIGVRATTRESTDAVAAAVARAFLAERRRYLDDRREDLVLRLGEELRALGTAGRGLSHVDLSAQLPRQQILDALLRMKYARPQVGQVVRQTESVEQRPAVEVGVAAGLGIGLLVALVITTAVPGARPPTWRRREQR